MTRDDVRQRLAAPFDPAAITWRVGATNADKTRGLALAYLDARDVMNRLDDVVGVFGWQSEHIIVGDRTICRLSLRDPETGQWVTRTDGAGDTDVEPEKGAFSSSLKRCAVNFGIGRYLYDVASPWVELEQKGKSQIIPERELMRLRGMLAGKAQSAQPAAAGDNGRGATRNAPAAAAGIPSAAATPKAQHPKWDYVSARSGEIANALKGAQTPNDASDIWSLNDRDLDLIVQVRPAYYQRLEKLRDEMLAKLRPAPAFPITGSAPELMGEP